MNWRDLAGTVGATAPILGTLIGGPAGPAIGALVASVLGTQGDPESVSAALAAGPDAAVKLRQIEADRAVKLQELLVDHAKAVLAAGVAHEQTAAQDRADARKLQTAAPSRMPAALTLMITVGFFATLGALLTYGKPEFGGDALMIMLGALGSAWAAATSYWLGTTSNSARKTELLASSQPANTAVSSPE